ncbi:MAG TPA: FG-GAP-like repeat-containing protein [Candidatus Eisenbacteria bacterium]|nr:FG-GAP-like repeat-containing protein [Candidatus Eisenbacteria bacterium]
MRAPSAGWSLAIASIAPILLALMGRPAFAVSFTDVGAGMTDVWVSAVAWADYDNDGDLDVVVAGEDAGGTRLTKLYRNSGGMSPAFSDVGAGLIGVRNGALAWGDYDNDGDLDLALSGLITGEASVARIYRNSGGANPTLLHVASLTGVHAGSAAWGDADRDGDLDLVLTGVDDGLTRIARIYRNSGGANPTFSDAGAGLTGTNSGVVAFGDYDDDGDPDILLTGFTGADRVTKLYRNDGSMIFTEVNVGLPNTLGNAAAWGDYDNDGDLDIVVTGFDGTGIVTKIYRNDPGPPRTFVDIGAGLTGAQLGSAAWGDCDNDGDLDLLISGSTLSAVFSKLYLNSGGPAPTFTDAGAGLLNVDASSLAWGDYDNDGDLDIMLTGRDSGMTPRTRLYRSDGAPPNTIPEPPSTLGATVNVSLVSLSWGLGGDGQTPAPGMTYNVRIGTTPGGFQTVSPMSGGNGYRRVVRLGNAKTELDLQLPAGDYYWSVQAVDGAFAGSAFAPEQRFWVQGFRQHASLAPFEGGSGGAAVWGDYDNDGDLDMLLTGADVPAALPMTKIYRNQSGSFVDIGAAIMGARFGSAAWGDYDHDGDLDILIAGDSIFINGPRSKVYRNEGNGTFTDIEAGLVGFAYSSVSWADYDNDGDLDILISGLEADGIGSTRLYRNHGDDGFLEVVTGLAGGAFATAWGDYDNDGDLDLLMGGAGDESGMLTLLYRNDSEDGFVLVPAAFAGFNSGSVAWGDYDHDGDLDVLLTGPLATRVYRNDGGASFALGFSAPNGGGAPWERSTSWADYDNDGDLDFFATGSDDFGLFRNDGGGTFSHVFSSVVPSREAAWGDFDNDGDLDLLTAGNGPTRVYRNDGVPPNAPPNPPGNLSAVRNGGSVTFSWAPTGDDRTPPLGVSYNLRVGTTPGGDQIVPSMAGASGYRRVVQLGNAQQRFSWTVLALPPGPYYWSVQAIDGGFLGSSFATSTVAVEDAGAMPTAAELGPAIPNPFSTESSLSFALPLRCHVEVAVFDLMGRRVRVLERGDRPAGRHRLQWDGRDESGVAQGNGVYLVRMTAADRTFTRKLALAR